jgi:hypothetical protein
MTEFFVSLCFENIFKKHQFFVGENLYEYPAIHNVLYPNEKWFTIQMIGPFSTYDEASRIYCRWNVPGKKRGELLTIGLQIKDKYKLQMWTDHTPTTPLAIKENEYIMPPLTVKIVKTVLLDKIKKC